MLRPEPMPMQTSWSSRLTTTETIRSSKIAGEVKKLKVISLIVFTFLVISVVQAKAQANNSKEASASAMTSVDIVLPIVARETSQLSFGRFYPSQQGGTITISPGGGVDANGVSIVASVTSAGVFTISGQGEATFAICLPTGPAILTSSDGSGRTMQVNNWVSVPENGDARVRLAGGAQTVSIGATLQVGSVDQNPRGVYSGTYEVAFGYN